MHPTIKCEVYRTCTYTKRGMGIRLGGEVWDKTYWERYGNETLGGMGMRHIGRGMGMRYILGTSS